MLYVMLEKIGLGNQMFTYAYARYLQILFVQRNKKIEQIGINSFQFTFGAPSKVVEDRSLSLQHFKLNPSVRFLSESEQKVNREEYRNKLKKESGLHNRIIHNRIIGRFFNSKRFGELDYKYRFRRGLYVSYRPHSTFYNIFSESVDKYVNGYYQDAKPLYKIKDILREDFKINTPPNEKNREFLDKIHNTNSVCLHIRRGDYLTVKHLNICTEEYYRRGVQYIQEKVPNATFFVFSNTHEELVWIKENYNFENANLVYVDSNNPDYEELRLMKACKYFVISNSSFSWWAAFLAEYQEKIVCMPDLWDLEYPGDANMYVPGWIKISVKKE